MKYSMPIAIAAILISVLMIGTGTAADEGRYKIMYSERGEMEAWLVPSREFIHLAPQMYFKIYGVWPESFGQIWDAGLVRRDLSISGEYIITPDNAQFDHNDDVTYYPAQAGRAPRIAERGQIPVAFKHEKVGSTPAIGYGIELPSLEMDDTWDAEYTRTMESLMENQHYSDNSASIERMRNRIDHEGVQKLLSIAHMCMYGLTGYELHYGRLPRTWSEFVDTGFCPVTSDMKNPVTGGDFSTDGSPYSFRFNESENGGVSVLLIGENGEVL